MIIPPKTTVEIKHELADIQILPNKYIPQLLVDKVKDLLDGFSKERWHPDLHILGMHGWKPGHKLEYVRALRGISQLELASLVKMSQSTICKYERNEREITKKAAIRLADILNCNFKELM